MSKINSKELRNMGREDIIVKLNDLQKDLIKERAQIAVGTTPKSPGQIKQIKKTIARIKQILHENKIEVTKDK